MADTASNILLLRLQSTGSNTNLWGGYVNDIFETLERAQKGYQEYTVTGDATISWANYTKTNVGAVASFKLVGTPTAAATLTFPSRQHFLLVWNASGQSVTIKCSGGTGVTLADGQRAIIVCNGTDYANWAPTVFPTADITFGGRLRNVTAGTVGTDAVNLTQMQAAISVLSTAQNGLVLNSATATASQYLEDALAVTSGGGLSKSKTNAGTATEATAFELELSGMTALTSPADADVVPVYDASAAAHRKMTLANLLIAGWSSLTDVRDLDSVLLYDASAALIKKALLADVVRRQNVSSRFFATA